MNTPAPLTELSDQVMRYELTSGRKVEIERATFPGAYISVYAAAHAETDDDPVSRDYCGTAAEVLEHLFHVAPIPSNIYDTLRTYTLTDGENRWQFQAANLEASLDRSDEWAALFPKAGFPTDGRGHRAPIELAATDWCGSSLSGFLNVPAPSAEPACVGDNHSWVRVPHSPDPKEYRNVCQICGAFMVHTYHAPRSLPRVTFAPATPESEAQAADHVGQVTQAFLRGFADAAGLLEMEAEEAWHVFGESKSDSQMRVDELGGFESGLVQGALYADQVSEPKQFVMQWYGYPIEPCQLRDVLGLTAEDMKAARALPVDGSISDPNRWKLTRTA